MERKREEERERIWNKKIARPNAIREEEELKRKAWSELLDVAHHGVESQTMFGPSLKN